MKKFINIIIIIFFILLIGYIYRENIAYFVIDNFIIPKEEIKYKDNDYSYKKDYAYVQINDSFYPHNKQDILNIIYTRLDQGIDEFYFYCDKEYPNCINDVKEITSNSSKISEINNFIHPFNSYDKLAITFDSFDKIVIKSQKLYSQQEINEINLKVDEIIKNNITNNMSDKEKLKTIHDYIINNTKYDGQKADAIKNNTKIPNTYKSQKAYGPLIQGMGICGGYSDALAIFLDRLNIQNYKIASSNHIWNLVKLDKWYHIDLTWDDPVTTDGSDALINDFFLINTYKLQELDLTQHNFNLNIYQEAKNS